MSRPASDRNGSRRDPSPRPNPLTHQVLRLLWREHRISRAEIARRCGLSRSTVTEIMDELLPTGLVAEVGVGRSRGGRPPIVLEFQYDAACILGVEMGAAHLSVALTDLNGTVQAWEHQLHPVRTDPEGTRALIRELGDSCLGAVAGVAPSFDVTSAVPPPVTNTRPSATVTTAGSDEA